MTQAAVLITGGGGYIGAQTAWCAADAGHRVVLYDNLSTGHADRLPPEAELVPGELGDRRKLGQTLQKHRIDTVFHLAASTSVPESVADPLLYYRQNLADSIGLLQCCAEQQVAHFILSSTAAVYAPSDTGVFSEDSPTVPLSPYGWSKLMLEQVLGDFAAASSVRCAALRYFNVAGADPDLRCSQRTPQAKHLLKVACEVAVGSRERMTVYGTDYPTPDGTGVRDYIHVWDIAQAHLHVLSLLHGGERRLTFNCGTGKGASVLQVLDALQSILGRKLNYRLGQRRPGDAAISIASPERLKRTGWQPRYPDLKDIVAAALQAEQLQRPASDIV